MKEKNMKKILLVILMIIIIALTGCSIYYQIDRFNKKEKTSVKENIEKPKEKVERLNTDSEEVTKLMNSINSVNKNISINGEDKMGYFYLKDSYKQNEIDDSIKLLLGLNTFDLNQLYQADNKAILSAEEVKTSIKNIFGPNVTYNDVIKLDTCNEKIGITTFDSTSNNYTVLAPACGGTLLPYYKTKIMSATKYDDRIEIKEKAIYVVPNLQDMNNMTSNIYKANKLELISENTNVDNGSEEEYEKYFEKTDTYKYIFKLENENYYFESVEKIN